MESEELKRAINNIGKSASPAIVAGLISVVGVEKTRPANATAYAAKDVINESASAGTLWTFEGLGSREGGSGYIVKARLLTDQSTNTATYRVHLFHTSITALNDNAPNTILYADNASRIGSFDLVAMTTEDATSTAASTMDATLRIPYKCAAGSQKIYAVLETTLAFTPASGQKFYLELTADNN